MRLKWTHYSTKTTITNTCFYWILHRIPHILTPCNGKLNQQSLNMLLCAKWSAEETLWKQEYIQGPGKKKRKRMYLTFGIFLFFGSTVESLQTPEHSWQPSLPEFCRSGDAACSWGCFCFFQGCFNKKFKLQFRGVDLDHCFPLPCLSKP